MQQSPQVTSWCCLLCRWAETTVVRLLLDCTALTTSTACLRSPLSLSLCLCLSLSFSATLSAFVSLTIHGNLTGITLLILFLPLSPSPPSPRPQPHLCTCAYTHAPTHPHTHHYLHTTTYWNMPPFLSVNLKLGRKWDVQILALNTFDLKRQDTKNLKGRIFRQSACLKTESRILKITGITEDTSTSRKIVCLLVA